MAIVRQITLILGLVTSVGQAISPAQDPDAGFAGRTSETYGGFRMPKKKRISRFVDVPEGHKRFRRSEAEEIIERLQTSSNPHFRQSTFLGFDVQAARNEVLHADALRQNGMLILGATRSGKSALLALLSRQRILKNDALFCLVDLKGDDDLLHSILADAHKVQRPTYVFSNVNYLPTRIFNPLDQRHLSAITRTQIGELIATSTNLSHPPGYGSSHFSLQNLQAFVDGVVPQTSSGWRRSQNRKRVHSFVELQKTMRDAVRRRRELKHPEAAITLVSQLAEMSAINGVAGMPGISDEAAAGAIHVWDLLFPDQHGRYPVIFIYLRADAATQTAPLIGKLFINNLKNALRQYTDFVKQGWIDAKPLEVDLVIDEAAYVLDSSAHSIVDQAQGMGLRLTLAMQDIDQLDSPRFARTAFNNVGTKIVLTCRDVEWQNTLMSLSGEKPIHHINYSIAGRDLARGHVSAGASLDGIYGVRREPGPRLERNHLIEISDTPNRAIYIPAQGASVTQYRGYSTVIDIPFLHSPEKHAYIQSLPWIERTPEMIVPIEFQSEWEQYVERERRNRT